MQRIPFDLEVYRSQMHNFIGGLPNEEVFWQALDFATEAHYEQWRRSGDAYILHPCSVAKVLAEEMDIVHPEILAAALLHDTVEDVEEVTIELVGEKFGPYVQAIVEGCTKVTHFSGDKQSHSRLIHRKIFSGAALRPEVMLVKLADRLHNLRTLQAMPRRKRQRIADETLDIYAPLATVFGLFNMKREMYNLALFYKFPKQGARLMGAIRQLGETSVVIDIVERLRHEAQEMEIRCTVDIRTKELWAYYDHKNRILLKAIDYPVEILIVVDNAEACYQSLGMLNQMFPPIPRTIRDFIANPKPTGYQGLHARAIVKGQRFLFKIRTEEMARRAQRGLFRNWSSESGKQRQFIREIKEMFDVLSSDESVSYRDVIAASSTKEIYTYTPQGDLICLPHRSTVLDFAFRVHTDIGHSCLGAMIGNKRVPPDNILRDGDVVRIIRADEQVQFDQQILEKCQTPRTRAELAKRFRLRRSQVAREVGYATLCQELERYGLSTDVLESPDMQRILNFFSLENVDDICRYIGDGRLRLPEIIHRFRMDLYNGNLPAIQTGNEANNSIELDVLDPVSIKLSACCKPNPTDRNNCALLTKNWLSVHRKTCPRLLEMKLHREDMVDIIWNAEKTLVQKKQAIHVLEASRQRIMMIAAVAPEGMRIQDLTLLSAKPTQTPAWQLTFAVSNLSTLQRVLKHFNKSGIPYEFEFDY
jgi:GTP diphosphokinase / guanosine-3',5'-bis(diphosphate) 3'-diphosphatase